MSVVSPELGIRAFERGVSVRLGLLDTVLGRACQSFSVTLACKPPVLLLRWEGLTRSCAPSCSGCVATSSWILRHVSGLRWDRLG